MDLEQLGWKPVFEAYYAEYREFGWVPARIVREDRGYYRLRDTKGEWLAEVTGKFRHEATCRADYPRVGDWVVIERSDADHTAQIHAVLPRFSSFSRKEAGKADEEQVVAANIETVFLVSALDREYNLRRIERYLTLAWESGARPVVVLNKMDLCEDAEAFLAEVEDVAPGVDVHAVSARTGNGIDTLNSYLKAGDTVVFLGSSGVGKSTLINRLLGTERQRTGEIREEDGKGRHTTTHRELILLQNGAMVVDTPGLREIQLWVDDEGLQQAFEDVEEVAQLCKFRDCLHDEEPGCAVREAVENGKLDAARVNNYKKQRDEMARLARKQTLAGKMQSKSSGKKMGRLRKQVKKIKSKR